MNFLAACSVRNASITVVSLLVWLLCQHFACANPTAGTVAQGAATFNTSGSQLTVNAANNTFINWQSFNIGAGETTTFIQPSASSLVWNQISDSNPSQILGSLNANGYVVLQNQSGFYMGGQASISAHGLILTTTPTPMPDLSSGGAWSFNTPPPTAKIINYGQINITGGGSAFLIASDIENANDGTYSGTISDPGGKIGLYAGEKVLVSTSPDGRGLSAEVTLPEGVVNNQGQLIADGGNIVLNAQTVNQGGLIQANSVQNINGTIELLASDSLNMGASSTISANGDSTATAASPGGFVVLNSGNSFADTPTSTITVSGQSGGQDGIVEIFGNGVNASTIQSSIGNNFALLINPYDITLSSSGTDTSSSSPNFYVGDLSSYSQIDLQALDSIELSSTWTLNDPGAAAALNLTAGNNLVLDDGAAIVANNNWSVNMTSGAQLPSGSLPTDGNDGIYLNGSAYIQTQNGDINLWAANEVLIATGESAVGNGIRTLNGGNIDVTAEYGNVNTGANPQGFIYQKNAPYNTVSPTFGGISTANGGNVTINAGGDVISYNPGGTTVGGDAGTGAFGSEPGNVTITAGGNVYGHYVLADGVGTITAGDTVGTASGNESFALSLIDGTWNVNAPNGNIYLQEVRNPNGIFNTTGNAKSAAYHLFNYDPQAKVDLTAGIGVYLTDVDVPRPTIQGTQIPIQVIYPPILNISAGSGGVTLQDNVTLFPSADQNLTITTTAGGNLVSTPNNPGEIPELLMSDSSQTRWVNGNTFSDSDHGTGVPVQASSSDPVVINISGSMENLTLITTKETQIMVDGNMTGCGFSGQNLSSSDVTSITVLGQIYNQSPYSFIYGVNIPTIPTTDLLPGMADSWDDIFTLALNPTSIANLTVPAFIPASQWAFYAIQSAALFSVEILPNGQLLGSNPGFVYNLATGRFGYQGQMDQSVLSALGLSGQPITVLHLVNGEPVLGSNGHFLTDTINWAPPSDVETLFTDSAGAPSVNDGQLGYRLGGPGQFDIDAGSMELGNTYGILSTGVADTQGGFGRYANLASLTPSGATVNVTVAGDLDMLTSTIAAIGGGDVNVISTGGSIDLGSQELFSTVRQVGFGIFTSGHGNVNVTALGDIDIDGSRIASFNGGNIFIESLQGTVNVGSGGDTYNGVGVSYVDPATGVAGFYTELVYGSGIVANTLVDPSQVPGGAVHPGNITVNTPQGDIIASLGGILQEALNGNISGGPTITLNAGTLPSGTLGTPGYSPGHAGNIDLGNSGVIGGTVNLTANGNISGLVISRQNSTINAAQNFNGTLLSAGSADVTTGGTVAGTIIGVGGANVSGSSISASVLGQNVSVNGGAAQSTLGSSANASSTSQSASQQASQSANQQVASTGTDNDKDKKKLPTLQRIKRVTVILPKAS